MSATNVISAVNDPSEELGATEFQRDLAGRIRAAWDQPSGGLDLCLERLRQQVLSDRVAFYFNVAARFEQGRLALEGEVERSEFKAITLGVFRQLGHTSLVDRLEVVPDVRAAAGFFGVASVPHVLTWSRPDLTGIPMDEALLGEPVYLLKELPTAWLLKTFTGYWGYAGKNQVRRVDRETFIRFLNQPKVTLVQDCQAGQTRLPAGCRLPIVEWGAADSCQVLGPDGGTLAVPKSFCQRHPREEDMARVVAQARQFFNTPYQMGGKSHTTGIDCSGLVQLSYRAIGLSLPRDAKQQYLGGYLIHPAVREALLPGDALFFMNEAGQVDHTGLYLGNREMIHATMPKVTIQSLDPAATNYCKRFDRDFLGAKRFWW